MGSAVASEAVVVAALESIVAGTAAGVSCTDCGTSDMTLVKVRGCECTEETMAPSRSSARGLFTARQASVSVMGIRVGSGTSQMQCQRIGNVWRQS